MQLLKIKVLQIFLLASLFIVHSAFANVVGSVIFKSGDVSITHEDKSTIAAEKNLSLNTGDTIETREGRVQFSLIDGGKVSLQPNSIFKISKYEFSGKEDGSEYAIMELIKGGLRTITGLIGHKNRERYKLKTTVATIGIRGTEFTVNFNNNLFLMTTNHGSVDVCGTTGSCLNAVTGQSIVVSGAGGAPAFSSKAAKAAAAAPDSGKTTFAVSDAISNSGIPSVINSTSNSSITNLTSANLLSVFSDIGNGTASFAINTNLKVAANGQLTNINYNPSPADKFELSPISFASYNTDNIVSWGQATAGTYNFTSGGTVNDVGDSIQKFDYIVGITPNPGTLASLSGTYDVFASTAPFLVVNGVNTSTVGAVNSTTGNFVFNFAAAPNFTYTLNVNASVLNDTYNLTGSGNLNPNNPVFTATGSILSSAGSCQTGCSTGLPLQSSQLIQGAFFGANGERIGLQYGFNVPGLGGNINGSAVLSPTTAVPGF
ncbi:MAG: FecR domain-containing protein [Methylophilaceae bacterium]